MSKIIFACLSALVATTFSTTEAAYNSSYTNIPGRGMDENLNDSSFSRDDSYYSQSPRNGNVYYTQNQDSNSKYPQDRAATETDRQLNSRIRDKISGWFSDNYKKVSLNTTNGAVIIIGVVKSNEDITNLVNEIRKLEGVRSVNAKIQVVEKDNDDSNYSRNPQDGAYYSRTQEGSYYSRNPHDGSYSRNSQEGSYFSRNPQDGSYSRNPQEGSYFSRNPQDGYYSRHAQEGSSYSRDGAYYSQNAQETATTSKYPQDRGATDIDRQLNNKIRDKITGWFSDSYKNVALNTSNGDVNISGSVRNNDDLTALLKEIRKVDGVRSVNSNVQINDRQ